MQLKNLEKYLHPEEGGDDGAGGAAEFDTNFMSLKRRKFEVQTSFLMRIYFPNHRFVQILWQGIMMMS